uniref:DNA binding protein n=1 Tax=Dulem virus 197 TaxID=3145674 RepID=A0AAU8AYQ7_9VIRU
MKMSKRMRKSNKKADRRMFKRTAARTRKANVPDVQMRGGIRL